MKDACRRQLEQTQLQEKGEKKVGKVRQDLILTNNKLEFYSGDNGDYY